MLKQYFSVLKMCLDYKLYRNTWLIIALGRRNVSPPKLSKIQADICRSYCQSDGDYLLAWRLWTGWWESGRGPWIASALAFSSMPRSHQVQWGQAGGGKQQPPSFFLGHLGASILTLTPALDQGACIAAMHDLGSNLQWLEIPMGFSELQNTVGLISE